MGLRYFGAAGPRGPPCPRAFPRVPRGLRQLQKLRSSSLRYSILQTSTRRYNVRSRHARPPRSRSVGIMRRRSPTFCTDVIEQEARRRAVDGYDRPVFQGGKLVGVVRVYSDQLTAMLLRGRRPQIYRDPAGRTTPTASITIHGGLPPNVDDGKPDRSSF